MKSFHKPTHFLRHIIQEDLSRWEQQGLNQKIVLRFPPEPNGFLHIGHARSLCLNFGLAEEIPGARCHLRFDDTNPLGEEELFAKSIEEDIQWLGFHWGEHLYHASDYFGKLYTCAQDLIKRNLAYVCDLSMDELRQQRGSISEAGQESPYRNRRPEESLKLLEGMRLGEFPEGSRVLRAKIQMDAGNLVMRDPILYRIRLASHPKTGKTWCIYPTYDFAHGLSDAFEGITHSFCTLEFETRRALYDWFVNQFEFVLPPKQIEFARLNIQGTVTSKRRIKDLVERGVVQGWDDPRLSTLRALRRRGVPPSAIRKFCDSLGVSRKETTVPMEVFEGFIRDELNEKALRVFGLLHPLKVEITNYPETEVDPIAIPWHPQDPNQGMRKIKFSKILYIDREDFSLNPPPGYHRLVLGGSVRLRYGYVITCEEVVYGKDGSVESLKATFNPETLGGKGPKIKGIIHWVSQNDGCWGKVRLYGPLFLDEHCEKVNPQSLEEISSYMDRSLQNMKIGSQVQLERVGYFSKDPDSTQETPILNSIVSLRESKSKV